MNMQNLMAQAQKMQRDMAKKREEINNSEFVGKSEWVEIILTGKKEIKSFKLLVDSVSDGDDKEMLEDMIKIAHNDAVSKIDMEVKSKMGAFGDSLNGLM